MRSTYLTLGLLCLSEQLTLAASKVMLRSPGHEMLYHEMSMNQRVRRKADAALSHADISRREAEPEPIPLAQAPSASPTDSLRINARQAALLPSNNDTQTACTEKLKALKGKPSNPSGMSACYNVAGFDNSTGAFQAHVLIYMIGPATGNWTSLQPKTNQVRLSYPGAMIKQGTSPVSSDSVSSSASATASASASSSATPSAPAEPKLMGDVTFFGTVNKDFSSQLTNVTAMRASLQPNVTLAAMTTTGETLNVTLSNQEAAFVNGFFDDAAIAAAATPTPFVLPGVTLGIFPVGLIITSVWAVLFIVAVGAGTVGRFKFRTAYRRRTAGGQYGGVTSGGGGGSKIAAAYDKVRR